MNEAFPSRNLLPSEASFRSPSCRPGPADAFTVVMVRVAQIAEIPPEITEQPLLIGQDVDQSGVSPDGIDSPE